MRPGSIFSSALLGIALSLSSFAEPANLEIPAENARTVISSNHLEVTNTDEGNLFVFEGDVSIVGADFIAECARMEVRTEPSESGDFGAISVIEAIGQVRIRQGDRIATAGRALIYPERDEVVLEDKPKVKDGNGTITGYRMVLRGADRRITVEPGPGGEQPQVDLPSLDSIRPDDNNE